MKNMILNAKNFTLRPVHAGDADSIAHFANNPKIFNNVRDAFPTPYTLDDAKRFIEMTVPEGNNPQTNFGIDINGAIVGMIGLHPKNDVYRKNNELGYWLGEPFWNRGILTDAVKLVVAHAFENFDVHRIYAGIFSSNPASMRVLEKAEFSLEAILKSSVYKNNMFLDEFIFAKRK